MSWFGLGTKTAGKADDIAASTKLLARTDDLGAAARIATKTDDIADAARAARKTDDLADAARASRKTDDLADAAKKSKKLSDEAKALIAGGVGLGAVYYLDQQYKNEKEEVKDCMKVCLPENWDDHKYGDLKKSELKYREISDAGDQPVCTTEIDECGLYCGEKCKELHDYDAPGSGLLGGLAGDVGEGAGDLFSGLFGGLFEGLGIDSNTAMIGSSVSFICCCMLIIMIVLLR